MLTLGSVLLLYQQSQSFDYGRHQNSVLSAWSWPTTTGMTCADPGGGVLGVRPPRHPVLVTQTTFALQFNPTQARPSKDSHT